VQAFRAGLSVVVNYLKNHPICCRPGAASEIVLGHGGTLDPCDSAWT
jgi:hypothetical protein